MNVFPYLCHDKQALVSAIVKRGRAYIKLRKALSSLNGALPDATFEEICAFNDECAICRVSNSLKLCFKTVVSYLFVRT